jgi:hypothetical protein
VGNFNSALDTAGTTRRSGCTGSRPGLPADTPPKATVALRVRVAAFDDEDRQSRAWAAPLGGCGAGRPAEQRCLQSVIVPLGSERPCDLCSFGPLQSCAVPRPIEQLRAICRSPRPTSNFNRRTSSILRIDNLLAGKLILPFEGRLPAIVLSSNATCLWKSFRRSRTQFRDQPELFGFSPERSRSLRNQRSPSAESPP